MLFSLNFQPLWTQNSDSAIYMQSKGNMGKYYAKLCEGQAIVYKLGYIMDKAGHGYTLIKMDTLNQENDTVYQGQNQTLKQAAEYALLTIHADKTKEIELDPYISPIKFNTDVNQAYFYKRWTALNQTFYQNYSLNGYSGANQFWAWEKLNQKEMELEQFSPYADSLLNHHFDSLSVQQEEYTITYDLLMAEMDHLSYDTLLSGIRKLVAGPDNRSRYFAAIVKAVSQQHPEYYFRLAEDLPEHKTDIFYSADTDKAVIKKLKAVPGHKAVKKEFFGQRRFEKYMVYESIFLTVAFVGLITWLIVK